MISVNIVAPVPELLTFEQLNHGDTVVIVQGAAVSGPFVVLGDNGREAGLLSLKPANIIASFIGESAMNKQLKFRRCNLKIEVQLI